MTAALWCISAICLVQSTQILTCNRYLAGPQPEIAKRAYELKHAGEVLVTECKANPADKFQLNWIHNEDGK